MAIYDQQIKEEEERKKRLEALKAVRASTSAQNNAVPESTASARQVMTATQLRGNTYDLETGQIKPTQRGYDPRFDDPNYGKPEKKKQPDQGYGTVQSPTYGTLAKTTPTYEGPAQDMTISGPQPHSFTNSQYTQYRQQVAPDPNYSIYDVNEKPSDTPKPRTNWFDVMVNNVRDWTGGGDVNQPFVDALQANEKSQEWMDKGKLNPQDMQLPTPKATEYYYQLQDEYMQRPSYEEQYNLDQGQTRMQNADEIYNQEIGDAPIPGIWQTMRASYLAGTRGLAPETARRLENAFNNILNMSIWGANYVESEPMGPPAQDEAGNWRPTGHSIGEYAKSFVELPAWTGADPLTGDPLPRYSPTNVDAPQYGSPTGSNFVQGLLDLSGLPNLSWLPRYYADAASKSLDITAEARGGDLANMSQREYDIATWSMLNTYSGPEAVANTYGALANQEQMVMDLKREAQREMVRGNPEQATAKNMEAARLADMTQADVVDEFSRPGPELLYSMILDPLNLIDVATSMAKLGPVARRTADVLEGVGDAAMMEKGTQKAYNAIEKVMLEQGEKEWAQTMGRELGAVFTPSVGTVEEPMAKGNWLWDSIKGLPQATNKAKVTLQEHSLFNMAAATLGQASTKEEAIALLTAMGRDPRTLLSGVQGADNVLISQFGGVIFSDDVLEALPLLEGIDQSAALWPSLTRKDGAFDITEVLADFDDYVYERARRELGLAESEIPARTSKVRVSTPDADGNVTVQYLDVEDNVLAQTEPMSTSAANDILKEQGVDLNKFLTDNKGVLKATADLTREYMTAIYLHARPAHWIRNAASAASHIMVDGSTSFRSIDTVIGDLTRWGNGVIPNRRIAEAYQDFLSEVGRVAQGAEGQMGARTAKQPWYLRGKYNPMTDKEGVVRWQSTGKTLGVIAGEELMHAHAYYVPFRRALSKRWETSLAELLMPAFTSSGVDREVARGIVDQLIDAGMYGNKKEVLNTVNQLLGGTPASYSSLRAAGVTEDVLHIDTYRGIDDTLKRLSRGEISNEDALRAVDDLINADLTIEYQRMAQTPPVPAQRSYLSMDNAADLNDVGRRVEQNMLQAGVPPAQAKETARQTVEGLRGQFGDSGVEAQGYKDLMASADPTGDDLIRQRNVIGEAYWQTSSIKSKARQAQEVLWEESRKSVAQGADPAQVWGVDYPKEVKKIWDDAMSEISTVFTDAQTHMADVAYQPRRNAWPGALDRVAGAGMDEIERIVGGGQATLRERISAVRQYVDYHASGAYHTAQNYGMGPDDILSLVDAEQHISLDGHAVRVQTERLREQARAAAEAGDTARAQELYKQIDQMWQQHAYGAAAYWRSVTHRLLNNAAAAGAFGDNVASAVDEIHDVSRWAPQVEAFTGQLPEGAYTPTMPAPGAEITRKDILDAANYSGLPTAYGPEEAMATQSGVNDFNVPIIRHWNANHPDLPVASMDDIIDKGYARQLYDELIARGDKNPGYGPRPQSAAQAPAQVAPAPAPVRVDNSAEIASLNDEAMSIASVSPDSADYDVAQQRLAEINARLDELAAPAPAPAPAPAQGATGEANSIDDVRNFLSNFGKGVGESYRDAQRQAVAQTGKVMPQAEKSLEGQYFNRLVASGMEPTAAIDETFRVIDQYGYTVDDLNRAWAERGAQVAPAQAVPDLGPVLGPELPPVYGPELPVEGPMPAQFSWGQQLAANDPGGYTTARFGLDEAGEDLREVHRSVEQSRTAVHNQGQPTIAEITEARIEALENARTSVHDAVNNIAGQATPPTVPPEVVAVLRDPEFRRMIMQSWDNSLAAAQHAAEKVSEFTMLNYARRRGIDSLLSIFVPYHYWYTRSAKNWIERFVARPELISNFARTRKAIEDDRERLNRPQRLQGQIRIPEKVLGQEMPWASEQYDYYIQNPINYLIPFGELYAARGFGNPDEAKGALGQLVETMNLVGFGLMPPLEAAYKVSQGQGDTIQAADYFWPYRMFGSAMQAQGQGDVLPQTGFLSPYDEWNQYRIRRGIAQMQVGGELPADFKAFTQDEQTGIVQFAQAIAFNIEAGADRYDGIPEQFREPAEQLYQEAQIRVGQDRGMTEGSRFLTGLGVTRYDTAEDTASQTATDYRQAGYSEYTNELGSKYAQLQILEDKPWLAAWWSRVATPGEDQSPAYAGQAALYWSKEEQLWEQESAEIADYILSAPGSVDNDEVWAIRDKYKPLHDQNKADYPLALEMEGSDKGPTANMNPWEEASYDVERIVMDARPGDKPESPDPDWDDAAKKERYAEIGEWYDEWHTNIGKALAPFVVAPDDPMYGSATDEAVRYMITGQYVGDILRNFDKRYEYKSQPEIAYEEQRALQGEVQDQYWGQRDALYGQLDSEAQQLFGSDIQQWVDTYPGGGSKEQKKQWRDTVGKQFTANGEPVADTVYSYFGWSSERREELGLITPEGQRPPVPMAPPYPDTVGMPRPIGTNDQPLGGVTREEFVNQNQYDPIIGVADENKLIEPYSGQAINPDTGQPIPPDDPYFANPPDHNIHTPVPGVNSPAPITPQEQLGLDPLGVIEPDPRLTPDFWSNLASGVYADMVTPPAAYSGGGGGGGGWGRGGGGGGRYYGSGGGGGYDRPWDLPAIRMLGATRQYNFDRPDMRWYNILRLTNR